MLVKPVATETGPIGTGPNQFGRIATDLIVTLFTWHWALAEWNNDKLGVTGVSLQETTGLGYVHRGIGHLPKSSFLNAFLFFLTQTCHICHRWHIDIGSTVLSISISPRSRHGWLKRLAPPKVKPGFQRCLDKRGFGQPKRCCNHMIQITQSSLLSFQIKWNRAAKHVCTSVTGSTEPRLQSTPP